MKEKRKLTFSTTMGMSLLLWYQQVQTLKYLHIKWKCEVTCKFIEEIEERYDIFG